MKCTVVELDVMSIKENNFIPDSVVTTYSRELGSGFYPAVSIHITVWCIVDYPVQWGVEVEILGLIICLVHNDGGRGSFLIGSGKDK